MSHHCTEWRTQTEWREVSAEPETTWRVQQQYRVTRCQECEQERFSQPTKLRRRSRGVTRLEEASPPDSLLKWIPPQQWRTLDQVLKLSGGNRLGLERQLLQWLNEGWLEVEEQQDRYRSQWQLTKVRLSGAAYQTLIEHPQAQRQAEQTAALTETLAIIEKWSEDLTQAQEIRAGDAEIQQLLQRLEVLLNEQEEALKKGRWIALPESHQLAGGVPHQRWLRILRGLLARLAEEGWEYERTFSARWLGHSKELARDRKQIEAYLGLLLKRFGIFRHTPLVLCWGKFTARFAGLPILGQAGVPFVALSAETVYQLTDFQLSATAIVVVENQTPFETLLRAPLRNDDYLYLYSGGYAGHAERTLLAAWLQMIPTLPCYIWTDWDADGVGIQADWERWILAHKLPAPKPWLWEEEQLAQWRSLGSPLSEKQRKKLTNLAHPLADRLLELGFILEQESVLPHLTPRLDLAY